MKGSTTKKAMKEIEALPPVPGAALSFLAEAFRDFITAQQEAPEVVLNVLMDIGWDRDDAKRILDMLRKGVGSIFDTVTDPLAEQFDKDTTVVRRKRG